jgi:hypothetical protein
LVRNIVESHGGELTLKNLDGEEEHGLMVTISLPLAETYLPQDHNSKTDEPYSENGKTYNIDKITPKFTGD